MTSRRDFMRQLAAGGTALMLSPNWFSSCKSKKTDNRTSYVMSDDSQFVPKTYYPKFSWNTTPMYYHFGDINRVLKPEEVKFIAERTNFITIEKSHAYKMLGDAVLGAKHAATAFHKIKPDIKVLFYFNSFVAWPYTRFNKNFTPDRINGHPDLKKFLIINPKTVKPDHSVAHGEYAFDILNPAFRKWWVASVVKGVKISGCDGVFIDRMDSNAYLDYRKDKTVEVVKAKGEMMAELRKKLGPDKILLGNNAADNKNVFPSCDAFMFEHYNASVTTKENLLKEWGDMLRIAKAGKISAFRFGPRTGGAKADRKPKAEAMEEWSKERLDFYLACYLIGAQPYSYFQYNWSWNLSGGDLVNYPELLKPLGPPKGLYKRVTPAGWVFTRAFEHASVWVNTEKREAKITWR